MPSAFWILHDRIPSDAQAVSVAIVVFIWFSPVPTVESAVAARGGSMFGQIRSRSSRTSAALTPRPAGQPRIGIPTLSLAFVAPCQESAERERERERESGSATSVMPVASIQSPAWPPKMYVVKADPGLSLDGWRGPGRIVTSVHTPAGKVLGVPDTFPGSHRSKVGVISTVFEHRSHIEMKKRFPAPHRGRRAGSLAVVLSPEYTPHAPVVSSWRVVRMAFVHPVGWPVTAWVEFVAAPVAEYAPHWNPIPFTSVSDFNSPFGCG
ncbi:hypothetical protein ACPXB3_16400 [Gordonia sp. DT219]|uniref:hypothetical protein n=1 Tax=Gordonia sp. DT219 TaxID=3416658 RepID=UPI003CEA4D8B